MSKLAAFAAGAGEGYFGAKRYKDSKARAEKQDELFEKALSIEERKVNNSEQDVAAAAMSAAGVTPPATARDDEEVRRDRAADRFGYAHGGMIGEMPNHHDKMMWQRASFKK